MSHDWTNLFLEKSLFLDESRNFKVKVCKSYNEKYMFASTQITNSETFVVHFFVVPQKVL